MPRRGRTSNNVRLAYIALALFVAISLTYRVREITDRVDLLRNGMERARNPFERDGLEVVSVQPDGFAAGAPQHDDMTIIVARIV